MTVRQTPLSPGQPIRATKQPQMSQSRPQTVVFAAQSRPSALVRSNGPQFVEAPGTPLPDRGVCNSSRNTTTSGGASIPSRTRSPDTRITVRTIELPSRIRSLSRRERTSILNLHVGMMLYECILLFRARQANLSKVPAGPSRSGIAHRRSRRSYLPSSAAISCCGLLAPNYAAALSNTGASSNWVFRNLSPRGP
jgi:hypothetical protein